MCVSNISPRDEERGANSFLGRRRRSAPSVQPEQEAGQGEEKYSERALLWLCLRRASLARTST